VVWDWFRLWYKGYNSEWMSEWVERFCRRSIFLKKNIYSASWIRCLLEIVCQHVVRNFECMMVLLYNDVGLETCIIWQYKANCLDCMTAYKQRISRHTIFRLDFQDSVDLWPWIVDMTELDFCIAWCRGLICWLRVIVWLIYWFISVPGITLSYEFGWGGFYSWDK